MPDSHPQHPEELQPWEVLSSKPLVENALFRIDEQECRLPNGSTGIYYMVDRADIVSIVALTVEGETVLNHQYKHGCGEVVCEIPAGAVKEGETPLQAAQREFEEETGYTAEQWTLVAEQIPSPSNGPLRHYVFLAEGAAPIGERQDDPREVIVNERLPFAELDEKIATGVINVTWSISAIKAVQLHLA